MWYNNITLNPIKVFLLDALGAMLTASLLFFALRGFHEFFGMPEKTLIYLSAIACLFCMYSFLCFMLLRANFAPFLRAIIILNLLYCCLTLSLVILHYDKLTKAGLAYFVAEIVVILFVVRLEQRTLSKNKM